MSGLERVIREIHRRSLWQVLGIYIAGSWIVLQVVDQLSESLGLPDWVDPLAVVLLLVGLPIVLATAFVQEGVGEGVGEAPGATPEPPAFREGVAEPPETSGSEIPPERPRPEDAGAPGLLTWRNALLGGAAAFSLLGLATAGYMAMRIFGIGPAGTLVAKGVLEERATLLLTDFESPDSLLAQAVTEAMRVDLSQSGVVKLAEPAFVNEALSRMGRESVGPLDLETGRELAEREGLPAVIGGTITPAGEGWVLSARLVGSGGETLVSERENAADEGGVIEAIDELARGLRERIGESYTSLREDPPLAQVTTPSLAALRKYSQAVRLLEVGDLTPAIRFLEDAVALDSTFAMAWLGLGTHLSNLNRERARAATALSRAFEHQDRLPERERYGIRGLYFLNITGEPERSIVEFERLLEIDPDHHSALNNIGVALYEMRDFQRAEAQFTRMRATDPSNWFAHYNAIELRGHLGRFAEARELLDSARARFGETGSIRWTAAQLHATEGELEEAIRVLRESEREAVAELAIRALLHSDLASLTAARGELEVAEEHLQTASDVNAAQQLPGDALRDVIQGAWIDLGVREDTAAALERLRAGRETWPLEGMEPLDRPYLPLAELYAAAGRPREARILLETFEREVPAILQGGMAREREQARGRLSLAEGRAEEAIETLRRADRGGCVPCALPGLARAYEAAGLPDSAAAIQERYATTPWFLRFYGDHYGEGGLLGPALERAADLYYEVGDLEKAASLYARFVELWAGADEELQPRVRAAQARLEEIVRERG